MVEDIRDKLNRMVIKLNLMKRQANDLPLNSDIRERANLAVRNYEKDIEQLKKNSNI